MMPQISPCPLIRQSNKAVPDSETFATQGKQPRAHAIVIRAFFATTSSFHDREPHPTPTREPIPPTKPRSPPAPEHGTRPPGKHCSPRRRRPKATEQRGPTRVRRPSPEKALQATGTRPKARHHAPP